MIITFCGHGSINIEQSEINEIKDFLIGKIKQHPNVKFYLGGYGYFDHLVFSILRKLKKDFSNIELIFISPYLDNSYSKLQIANKIYDGTIYPPLETVPKKFAILKRNEWMVDNCDLLVAYVKYPWGGARKTLDYAIRKKKSYINFAKKEKDRILFNPNSF
ncbi:MAG: hypothetical protein SPL13_02335 [Clostridia bacterium]|nr:hypothetical protein [Clostridia bacterium]